MSIFELEHGGKTFEVDAPDQASAVAGFKRYVGQQVDIGKVLFGGDAERDRTPEGPPDERSFLQKATSKVGSFLQNVYNNPPPTAAAIRDVVKGAPSAAQELTWGADPQAAERAAGTILGAAGLGLTGSRALQFPARAATEAAPAAANATLESAGRLGVDVPRYMATEGTSVPQLAAGMKNVPWAGEPIVQSAQRMTDQLGAARGRIAPAVSPEQAGVSAQQGLTNWIKEGGQKPVGEAYDAVDALINPAARAPLSNTSDMVAQILAERQQGRIDGRSKAVDAVFQAIQDPAGMDYKGTKLLRTSLGEKTPQELAVSGINPVEHKRIYGALSKDLGNIVREAGGDAAFSAWQEANALARLTNMQRQALSKIVGSKGDAAPEAVFSKLERYASSKSSADINRLRLAKQAMGKDAWDEVGSAMINRMGMAPDGTFSPDRFVTAFGNMSSAAKSQLFSGQQRAALEDLFSVSTFARDRISRFSNPSGTSRGMFGGGAVFGLMSEPMSVITGAVGTRLVASALSKPAVVRAATQVARQAKNPVAARQAQERLYQIAAREGLVAPQSVPQLEYMRR